MSWFLKMTTKLFCKQSGPASVEQACQTATKSWLWGNQANIRYHNNQFVMTHDLWKGGGDFARFVLSPQNLGPRFHRGWWTWWDPFPNDGGDFGNDDDVEEVGDADDDDDDDDYDDGNDWRTLGGSLPTSWTSGMRRRGSVSGDISHCRHIIIVIIIVICSVARVRWFYPMIIFTKIILLLTFWGSPKSHDSRHHDYFLFIVCTMIQINSDPQSFRSILILDDKSVIRHLAASSLPMDDLIDSARW